MTPSSSHRLGPAALLVSALLVSQSVMARAPDVAKIPNGQALGCANCHTNNDQNNLGPFNPWGRVIFDAERQVDWTVDCPLDPDEDGYTNGEELGDPACVWVSGDTPTEPFRSHPGDPESVPGELPPEPDLGPDLGLEPDATPDPGEPEPDPGEPEPDPTPDGGPRDGGGQNAGGVVTNLDDGCAVDPSAPAPWLWLLAGLAVTRRRR